MTTSTMEPKVSVINDRCKGCYLCVEVCPVDALAKSSVTNKKGIYVVELENYDACTQCGFCQLACPDFAIVAHKRTRGNQA